jgi:hypothetical protein
MLWFAWSSLARLIGIHDRDDHSFYTHVPRQYFRPVARPTNHTSASGDTLPSVLRRIETCIANDRIWQPRITANTSRTSLRDVLKRNVYLDGITFDCRALRAAVEAIGIDRPMFGTDHPLSPSLRTDGKYESNGQESLTNASVREPTSTRTSW